MNHFWLISLRSFLAIMCWICRTRVISYAVQDQYFQLLRNESFRGVVVDTRFRVTHYNRRRPHNERMAMSKDRIFGTSIVMFTKKDYSFVSQLNSHVQNMVSSGLMQYWEYAFLIGKKWKTPQEKVPEKLTLRQLEGIFYICAVLYAISILVFLLEIIVWNLKPRATFLDD